MNSSRLSDPEALYLRPFELLVASGATVGSVIPSAKLVRGAIDRNRYYVDLTVLARRMATAELADLAAELGMPDEARRRLDEEVKRYSEVRFVGAGPSRGRMSYRIYLGFGGEELRTVDSAVSIDWDPASGAWLRKQYDELRAIPRARELAVLDQVLGAQAGGPHEALAVRVRDEIASITGRARGALHVTQVREADGGRTSAAFNYYRCAYTGNEDIAAELDRLAAAFELPGDEYRAWRAATDSLQIIDVAAGRGWDGAPFVTVYHGMTERPLPYVASPAGGATPSSMGCGAADKVFAVGDVGWDLVNRTRRAALVAAGLAHPGDAGALSRFLEAHPHEADALHWTLVRDGEPRYVLAPRGAFASRTVEELRRALAREDRGSGGVAVAGRLVGQARLEDGRSLPVLAVSPDGVRRWHGPAAPEPSRMAAEDARALFQRLAEETRNDGLRPEDRALNFAVTSVAPVASALDEAARRGLSLQDIAVGTPPLGGRGERREVILTFFDASARQTRARWRYRITVDVTEVIPTLVGTPTSFYVY